MMSKKTKKLKAHPAPIDYHYIIDGIYIGTNQCCQMHFAKELLAKDITADISLEEKRVDAPFGVKFYLWLPVKDHTAPSQEQLAIGVLMLRKLVALKKKIYVHCKNGHGRAPTLVAAYLISRGKSVKEAVAIIKKHRPGAHLVPDQQRALAKFARG